MAVLITPFFLQFVDANGVPYAGGSVETLAAGSDARKATFTDFSEAVQAANPILLDSAGRCTIWGTGSYKFILRDAAGNQIKVTDNVTTFNIPAASGNSYFQSFSGNGAQTVFTLSQDLGADAKAVLFFVDSGAGKGYEVLNPNAFTLTSGATPTISFAVPPAAGANNIYGFAPSLLLAAASSSAAAAATSATNASTSETNSANSALVAQNAAAGLSGTSATSFLIGTGSKTFVTQAGKQFTAGGSVTIASAANPANFMFGQITGYAGTNLTVNVASLGGAGTFNDWIISVAGIQGVPGGAVSDGTKGEIVVSGGGTVYTIGATTKAAIKSVAQNSKSADYTLVLADAGGHIYHPSADVTARTFTIPANASVAFPIGTAITFVNDNGGGIITIAITTDTLILAGAGSTGSRTLAANGMATALKINATTWMISGAGLS